MRLVVALGGNALLRRDESPDSSIQRRHVTDAARSLVDLAREHEVVICHGNGPQIGLLAVESADDPALLAPFPLDDLGAQTQGMIGYWLAQELANAGPSRPVVALVSQVLVDDADPAFADPTKFIGVGLSDDEAAAMADARGWHVRRDGVRLRRVVPSPRPRALVEIDTVRTLLEAGCTVVCGGGGGIPVTRDPAGRLRGREAVVDKDSTAALAAIDLDADRLVVLTDVDAVQQDFGTPQARARSVLTVDELGSLGLPAGSMGPKVEACAHYVRTTGRVASIGSLERAREVLEGSSGTSIVPPDPGRLPGSVAR